MKAAATVTAGTRTKSPSGDSCCAVILSTVCRYKDATAHTARMHRTDSTVWDSLCLYIDCSHIMNGPDQELHKQPLQQPLEFYVYGAVACRLEGHLCQLPKHVPRLDSAGLHTPIVMTSGKNIYLHMTYVI